MLPAFIKKNGVSDKGQNIQILVIKKQGWFYSDFYNYVSWLLKSKRIVLKYYLNPASNIPSA